MKTFRSRGGDILSRENGDRGGESLETQPVPHNSVTGEAERSTPRAGRLAGRRIAPAHESRYFWKYSALVAM
jgi:hypothetical protein